MNIGANTPPPTVTVEEKYRGEVVYELVKEYPNFYLYKNQRTGIRTCFKRDELGMIPSYEKMEIKEMRSAKYKRDREGRIYGRLR